MFNAEVYDCKTSWLNFGLSTFFYVAYAVSSIIIYHFYLDVNCTSSINLISLQQWLLGFGIAFAIMPLFHMYVLLYHRKPFAIMYYSYVYFLSLPFNIGYSILGVIVLFRDSMPCLNSASPLFIDVLSSIISEWIFIVIIIFEIYHKYKREYKK